MAHGSADAQAAGRHNSMVKAALFENLIWNLHKMYY